MRVFTQDASVAAGAQLRNGSEGLNRMQAMTQPGKRGSRNIPAAFDRLALSGCPPASSDLGVAERGALQHQTEPKP
jgi:hypothetical protein